MCYYLIYDKKVKLFYFWQEDLKSMCAEIENTRDDHSLLLLHLSDIHFREPYCSKPDTDPDYVIRMELRNDIRNKILEHGKVSAIIISGDIAFCGSSAEYRAAANWISDIVSVAGCNIEDVYTVPGNHDVDRSIAEDRTIKGYRRDVIEKKNSIEKDKELRSILGKRDEGLKFLRPMSEYNLFAAAMGCDITPEQPFWVKKFRLSPGWSLKIHGLTSTLFSGPDDDEKGHLYLGGLQYVFPPEDGVIRASVMHHPPDWMSDQDTIDDSLSERCVLHLQGHKHLQRYLNTDQYVRVGAGAVNPDRSEGNWKPAYNFITLRVTQEGKENYLHFETDQRTWQESPDCFVSKKTNDGKDIFNHKIKLHNRPLEVGVTHQAKKKMVTVNNNQGIQNQSKKRELGKVVYDFWMHLTPIQRRDITQKLGLVNSDEMKLPETQRYHFIFKRAESSGIENILWDEIYSYLEK